MNKPSGPSRQSLEVVSSQGSRQRFLRGMITHDLMQRGLTFDEAYASACAIRDRCGDRETVSTAELRDFILEQLCYGDISIHPERVTCSRSYHGMGWSPMESFLLGKPHV